MRWDRFFDDLEDQVASEWEAERAALDTEAERLRLSTLTLAARLRALAPDSADAPGADVTVEAAADLLRGTVTAAGADWLALDLADTAAATVAALVPFAAVRGLALSHAALLATARPSGRPMGLRERMSFGFVLRDLVRRRLALAVHLVDGSVLRGTIDRAGADHLDLALHEPGSPRRAASVTGFRLIPFQAVAWVRLEAAAVIR